MGTDLSGPGLDGRLSGLLRAAADKCRRHGRPVVASLTEPIPLAEPIGLFHNAARTCTDRLLWMQPDCGFSLIGLGTAHVIEKGGQHRFSETATAWDTLCSGAMIEPAAFGNTLRTHYDGRLFLRQRSTGKRRLEGLSRSANGIAAGLCDRRRWPLVADPECRPAPRSWAGGRSARDRTDASCRAGRSGHRRRTFTMFTPVLRTAAALSRSAPSPDGASRSRPPPRRRAEATSEKSFWLAPSGCRPPSHLVPRRLYGGWSRAIRPVWFSRSRLVRTAFWAPPPSAC